MKLKGALACVLLVGCGSSPKKTTTPTPTGDQTATTTAPDTTAQTAAPAPAPAPAEKTLYERLGGKPAIEAVVNEFVTRTTTDPRIKERFFNVDADNLKKLLVQFVCKATGGPCEYEGRDMETTHAGMELVDDEFNALVEDLSGALDKFNVPAKEKGELLGALGPLKPQIVAPASELHPLDQKDLDKVTKLAAKLKQKDAQELLGYAVTAGQRGQRNYAERLFTRAEMITGPKALASVEKVFRKGAPKLVETKLTKMEDKGPQPEVVGNTDETEAPKPKTKDIAMLHGSLKIGGASPNGLGVVMLWPEKGGYAHRKAKERIIEQRNKTFLPHIMAVPVGSTVSFPNFDDIYHNVFSISKPASFDLGMYKNGESRSVKFSKPGIVRLGCNLHANMSAYLVVVDAPHYVITSADGSFDFKALAPGKYKVEAWDEHSAAPLETTVELKAGDNSSDFDLKGGAPAISPDKFGAARGQ
jgi:hemoglobin